ncbi:MAG: cytochrome P450 [Candidatus Dormibacteria bacterium]
MTSLPPGPPLPMPLATALWQLRFPEFLTYCQRRYGDYFTISLPVSRTLVAVSDPDAIKTVFADRGDRSHAGEGNMVLEPLLGSNSLLLLDGPPHARHRRLIHPSFHGSRMAKYAEIIRRATDAEVDAWPRDRAFPLLPSMQRLTLRVILVAVFGLAEGPEMDGVAELIRRVTAPGSSPLAAVALLKRDLGPIRVWSNFVRDRSRLDEALYAEISRRRSAADLEERDDILSTLLLARDEEGRRLTDLELRDELMTLLLAGHETTATALAWFFDQVLHHPEVEWRLRGEVRRGDRAYLDATINEVMRLRPVVGMVARKLTEDMRVGPYELPATAVVAPNIFLVHRRADLYPEPLSFRPQRFLDNRVESYAWLPFGGGTRRCVGAEFALFEMRNVIPRVLERVELFVADPRPDRISRRAVTLAPARGVPVHVGKIHSGL